jgi:hypothetical protein
MLLSTCANQVLQEFGGSMPDNLISFEDACREFISVRALELQKLGVSTTDITVRQQTINPSSRDALYPQVYGEDMVPGWVELIPTNQVGSERYKVEILPADLIPAYEGSRAIAFYGTPKRYRLAWDAWDEGSLAVFMDPVEDITSISLSTDVSFPPNFWVLLFKKAALKLVKVALMKLAIVDPTEFRQSKQEIKQALSAFASMIAQEVQEWEKEMRRSRSLDFNAQPHLRRSNDEIRARGYDNISGTVPGDFETY